MKNELLPSYSFSSQSNTHSKSFWNIYFKENFSINAVNALVYVVLENRENMNNELKQWKTKTQRRSLLRFKNCSYSIV